MTYSISRKGFLGFLVSFLFLSTSFSNALQASFNNNNAISFQFEEYSKCLYNDCQLSQKKLNYKVFKQALVGYYNMVQKGQIRANKSTLSIVDFSKPSYQKRLYIVDIKTRKVLHYTYVAHGKNTGLVSADKFSNTHQSLQSSLGFYKTAETYHGKHGYSLRLDGVERGFNSNARGRAVVMHGADYVSRDFVKRNGRLGRSWGCPAVSRAESKPIINNIKGGNCLFIYKNTNNYLQKSNLLNEYLAASFFVKNKYRFA
ncbi:MAG: murein L,D-transpeptidase catalytic domain family protein [Chitinophagales bacterium]